MEVDSAPAPFTPSFGPPTYAQHVAATKIQAAFRGFNQRRSNIVNGFARRPMAFWPRNRATRDLWVAGHGLLPRRLTPQQANLYRMRVAQHQRMLRKRRLPQDDQPIGDPRISSRLEDLILRERFYWYPRIRAATRIQASVRRRQAEQKLKRARRSVTLLSSRWRRGAALRSTWERYSRVPQATSDRWVKNARLYAMSVKRPDLYNQHVNRAENVIGKRMSALYRGAKARQAYERRLQSVAPATLQRIRRASQLYAHHYKNPEIFMAKRLVQLRLAARYRGIRDRDRMRPIVQAYRAEQARRASAATRIQAYERRRQGYNKAMNILASLPHEANVQRANAALDWAMSVRRPAEYQALLASRLPRPATPLLDSVMDDADELPVSPIVPRRLWLDEMYQQAGFRDKADLLAKVAAATKEQQKAVYASLRQKLVNARGHPAYQELRDLMKDVHRVIRPKEKRSQAAADDARAKARHERFLKRERAYEVIRRGLGSHIMARVRRYSGPISPTPRKPYIQYIRPVFPSYQRPVYPRKSTRRLDRSYKRRQPYSDPYKRKKKRVRFSKT